MDLLSAALVSTAASRGRFLLNMRWVGCLESSKLCMFLFFRDERGLLIF